MEWKKVKPIFALPKKSGYSQIIDFEARGNEVGAIAGMKKLQEFMYCNNIHIPGTSSSEEEE